MPALRQRVFTLLDSLSGADPRRPYLQALQLQRGHFRHPSMPTAFRGERAGLATPTAISAAIGNGARRGTLIKGGTHLEGIGRVTAVVFDKTGTLTFGRPLVTSVVTLSDRYTADQVLSLAASGELHARHPLAQAIVAHTEEQHLRAPIHQACEGVLGMGMRAELDGTRLLVGSPALLRRHGVELTEEAQGWTEQLRGGGETVICIAHDEDLIGLLGVSYAVRSGADTVIRQLTDLGVSRVVLLAGDAPETAQAVADTLGITEVHAHALPEGTLQLIRDLQAEGHTVAMVGDGTNDAPALALAEVGISMGAHSSHVALETADIALPGDDLRQVPAVVELSRHLWSGWPLATMTYEQDQEDLERHEREIAAHESFNYALFDDAGTALLGCVHIDPARKAGFDAEISWWVVDDRVGTALEHALDTLIRRWITDEWPFERPCFVGRDVSWQEWPALPDAA
ncbi:HAD-IC family P-type ATPase [Streptomyces lydicus]|uniref:HAD-IC family P-type ATPase n=1 Tax=Streptomyces lydicus TaxID=47763 RepID=UPI0037A675F4